MDFLENSGVTPDLARIAEIHRDPGFGVYFTDHMAKAIWCKDEGWQADEICRYGAISLDPGAAVLHYAQEIFEGMKAYRHSDGSIWLFRPEMNARRFNVSAKRLMLPEIPEADFIKAAARLVAVDQAWVPSSESGEHSLYLRPFMFASENFLGVRAAHEVSFYVIASPVGPYFTGGIKPVDIWVTKDYSRAGIGGTGAAKCGGNYASSLIAQYQGYEHGCSQVMFIEASGTDRVEELGGMNVFFVTTEAKLLTPKLRGTILPGITRDSVLTVAKDLGIETVVADLPATEIFQKLQTGEIVEAFACGTAAVITPIGSFKTNSGEYRLVKTGDLALKIRAAILDIQYGRSPDKYGWLQRVV